MSHSRNQKQCRHVRIDGSFFRPLSPSTCAKSIHSNVKVSARLLCAWVSTTPRTSLSVSLADSVRACVCMSVCIDANVLPVTPFGWLTILHKQNHGTGWFQMRPTAWALKSTSVIHRSANGLQEKNGKTFSKENITQIHFKISILKFQLLLRTIYILDVGSQRQQKRKSTKNNIQVFGLNWTKETTMKRKKEIQFEDK